MRYNYQALDKDGRRFKGVIDADSLEALRASIKAQGYFLINASKTRIDSKFEWPFSRNRLHVKDLSMFCRQMAAMLHAGVTLIRALDILYQQSENPKLKSTLQTLYEDVQKGDMFSDALRKQNCVFPPLLIAMVESGEAGGILDKVMARLATQYETDTKLKSKVKSALVYPCFIAIVALMAVIGLIVFVLPTFVGMYENSTVALPVLTSVLVKLSNIFRERWYIVIVSVATVVISLASYLKSESGIHLKDRIKLRFPVIKRTTIKVYAARFALALSNLVSSGIPLLNALDITSRVVNNSILMKKIELMREDVHTGITLTEALRKANIFPPVVPAMISIGEESGNLDEILDKTSEYLDEDVNSSITKLMSMLEPAMVLLVALLVGVIVIAMMLPLFGLTEVVQNQKSY